MSKNLVCGFLAVFLASTSAFADGYFKAGLMYMNDKSGTEGSEGDITRTLMDLGAGYIEPKGWTIGFLYSSDKYSSAGASVDRTAMGPTVGWMTTKDNGPYALATYFYTASYSSASMTGSGYQLDFGYKFAIRKVAFGAQLSKKHITFDKSNGQAMDPKYIEDKLDPYFVMLVNF